MGNDANNDQNRQPPQQPDNTQRQQPGQQNQQGGQQPKEGGQADQQGQRIDTDNDGRTRDPNDKSPTDNGGRG
ncbi:hypothetical protein ACO2Q3_08995 [Caulobacter sp. KR2-114]|uniref:hypothetical protein n=1 Tax=Caulobacter sp. KR2-114 TaxID=3400912 RepID=UPI003C07D9B5